MKSRHDYLYFFAFILAAALRFIQLGALPLTDSEATWALQALDIAQGSNPLLGSQPGYILLTSFFFYTLESTNFLARVVPAFAGSFLVFVPYFFRTVLSPLGGERREGASERVALIAAFLLAVAPGMVAVSRQANGTMIAVIYGAFAWGLWYNGKPQWAGIFAGMALLGGPSVWLGGLGLGLAWALAQSILPRENVDEPESSPNHVRFDKSTLKTLAIYGSGTILLIGTLFTFVPNGISAWFSSIVEFLRGWGAPSGISASRLLLMLVAYQPLALLFGSIAIVRGWMQRDRRVIALSLWLLTALVLALAYPARQAHDLLWAILPLWILTAFEINRFLRLPEIDRAEGLGVTALTFILLIFTWFNLAGMSVLPAGSPMITTRLILIAGSLILLVISLFLIAVGWSVETATLGGAWGTLLVLGIYTLGSAWGATGLRTPKGVEMWTYGTSVPQAGLLLESIDQISTFSTGDETSQPITIHGVDSPALLWLLRGYEIEQVSVLDPLDAPPLVITPYTTELGLAASYRGQGFVWRQTPNYAVAGNFAKWLVLHEMPQDSETIILWGRNDIFFDGQNMDTGISD